MFITQESYQIQRIHFHMLSVWREKNRAARLEIWFSNAMAGLFFGLSLSGCFEFFFFMHGKSYDNSWLLFGAIASVVITFFMTALNAFEDKKPSYDDAKFVYASRQS
ncbi:hypothetical protein [Vibrio anguillarum]|uniref:hypothetical protein n=1 Tax=Vibrio anguillarum TaxID=55601 RepID=UPI000BB46C4D|nr:hypothetical protein [Vibrio anguillarum]ATC60317.1 hypothetical protein CMV05_23290 [Vibrio anguillarum]